jgi:hypothetical protein
MSSPVATAAKPSPATATTGRFRACFVHVESAAIQFGSVQLSNGRLRILRVGHLYEGKAAGLTRVPVRDDIDSFNVAELGKSGEQVLLRGLEAEISYKNVAHGVLVRMFKLSR